MIFEKQGDVEDLNKILEKYMRIAFEEAEIVKERGENLFGAVVLDLEYNFCHKAHSRSIELSDPTAHAEVLVISGYYSVSQKELNKIIGGEQKPSCESLINSGFSQKHIVGNVLLN